MSKKPKHLETSKPQSAQLDAVRRLARQRMLEEARTKLKALRQRFPDYRPLLALAWEVEDEAGTPWGAAARALDWAEASPESATALSALVEAALTVGLAALGLATSIQLAALSGKPVEPMPTVGTPFGLMTGADAALTDISRILLTDGRFDELIERLRDATNLALRNNRGLARFAKSDVAGALGEFENNWQAQPLNLFALERMIRLRLWHRGRDHVAGLAAPMKATTPQRAEDALGKLTGLILLGEWDAAEASWLADSTGDYWIARNNDMRGLFDYAGAVVGLRRGKPATARERLQLAGKAGSSHQPIADLDRDLVSGSASEGWVVEVGETGAWFPVSWFHRLINLRKAGKSEVETKIRQHFATCDAHADYLGLAVEFGGKNAGVIALAILQQRAKQGDQEAKEQLISLLTRPCGPDIHRTRLLNWLSEEKLIVSGSPMPMLARGKIINVKPMSFRLTPEPVRDNPYPRDAQKLYEQMLGFLHGQQLDQAHVLALEICQKQPKVPMSHGNLALVKEAMGHSDDEVEAVFRRALTLDGDYTFARAGLTRVLARRGDVEAAKAMIENVLSREEYHFSEWRTILMAQRELALAQGEIAAVRSIDQSLRDLTNMERQ
jgi:tetratricopeptide (TPR) repeat protein